MKDNKKESKILKYIKEHKVIISVIFVIVVLIISGTTLSIFLTSGEGTEKSYTLGNVDVEYTEGNIIKAENAIPLADYEIEEYATKKEFSFQNTGNIPMYAEILLTDIEISDNLKNKNFVWKLYEKEDNNEYSEIGNGNFIDVDNKKTLSLKKGIHVVVGAEKKEYKLIIYIRDNGLDQNNMEKSNMSAKVTIIATDKPTEYVDDSGANPPKLADGMIPVIYDEDSEVWVKASLMKKWYDYDEQWWANAVTVSTDASTCTNNRSCVDDIPKHTREEYIKAKAGTPISMDDINTMWVWIPRYKYKIPSNLGSGASIPPEIDVVFETGLSATGVDEKSYRSGIKSDGTNENYYTHPTFRDGSEIYNSAPYDIGGWDKELTGIWAGKFETGIEDKNSKCYTSPSTANCIDVTPVIKPNVRSLTYQDIPTSISTSVKIANGIYDKETDDIQFTQDENNIYGFNTKKNNVSTHIVKSIDWGAISYLSQSKYGKMVNNNYGQNNKEVYINNSGPYIYTGRSSGSVPSKGLTSLTGGYSYNDYTCKTTDSNQCTGEKVIGSGIGASTTGTIYGVYDMVGGAEDLVMSKLNAKNPKFFDSYSKAVSSLEATILGDARWETKGWYNDFLDSSLNSPARGGPYFDNSNAGLFRFGYEPYGSELSYHSVLIL